MMALTIERDDHEWYIIDATGLGRVADTTTRHKGPALAICTVLNTGDLPEGWTYVAPAAQGRPGFLFDEDDQIATVWEPRHTAFATA